MIILCLFLAFQNFQSVLAVPFGEWEVVHYLLALVSLGLVGVAAFKGKTAYDKYKQKRDAKPEDGEEAGPEDAPAPLPPADEDDDLAYLDELDAEEDAKK